MPRNGFFFLFMVAVLAEAEKKTEEQVRGRRCRTLPLSQLEEIQLLTTSPAPRK